VENVFWWSFLLGRSWGRYTSNFTFWQIFSFSFRLQFETDSTNNVCEYEALVLGLEASRRMKIVNLIVFGDAELIVKQIRKVYPAKHLRMRSYRNYAWDLIENLFLTFNIHAIPRH
jgi:ribonuclease HI